MKNLSPPRPTTVVPFIPAQNFPPEVVRTFSASFPPEEGDGAFPEKPGAVFPPLVLLFSIRAVVLIERKGYLLFFSEGSSWRH